MTQNSIDEWFRLRFDSGKKVIARFDEEFVISSFYTNDGVIQLLGQEMCIALDVALATCGCEAIVEGFTVLLEPTNKMVVSRMKA